MNHNVRLLYSHIPLYICTSQWNLMHACMDECVRACIMLNSVCVCVCLSLSNPGVLKAGCSSLGGMAQTNSYGQSSNGVADESPNMLVYRKVGLSGLLSLHIALLTTIMHSPGNQLSALF